MHLSVDSRCPCSTVRMRLRQRLYPSDTVPYHGRWDFDGASAPRQPSRDTSNSMRSGEWGTGKIGRIEGHIDSLRRCTVASHFTDGIPLLRIPCADDQPANLWYRRPESQIMPSNPPALQRGCESRPERAPSSKAGRSGCELPRRVNLPMIAKFDQRSLMNRFRNPWPLGLRSHCDVSCLYHTIRLYAPGPCGRFCRYQWREWPVELEGRSILHDPRRGTMWRSCSSTFH